MGCSSSSGTEDRGPARKPPAGASTTRPPGSSPFHSSTGSDMKFLRMTDLDLAGKRVLVRADLNVPLEDGRITDDTRIRASVPGISLALQKGAAVMVTSHLGRPTEGE